MSNSFSAFLFLAAKRLFKSICAFLRKHPGENEEEEKGAGRIFVKYFEEARGMVTLLVLLGAAWTDIRSQRVPNRLLLAAFVARGALGLLDSLCLAAEPELSAGRTGLQAVLEAGMQMMKGTVRGCADSGLLMAVLLIPIWFRKGGFGMGDVKLTGMLALYCGAREAFLCFYCGLMAAALVCLALMAARKKSCGGRLPFAPFLLAGYCIRLLLRQ